MKAEKNELKLDAHCNLYRACENLYFEIAEKGYFKDFFTEKEKQEIFEHIFEAENQISKIIKGKFNGNT